MPPLATHPPPVRAVALFSGAAGLFLGLALLKFGNPVVLDHKVSSPSGFWQFLLWSWPVAWAYPLLAVLCLIGLWLVRRRLGLLKPMTWLPLAWSARKMRAESTTAFAIG